MRRLFLVIALVALAAPAWAQTLLLDHVPITQAAGTREFTGNLPDGISTVTLRLARCTTATPTLWASPSTTAHIQSSVSTDGGTTWLTWVGCGATGGIYIKRDSTEAPETTCRTSTPLPPRAGVQRRFRVVVTVTGPTLVTEVTLEVQ